MKTFRNFVLLSIALVILYVLVSKSEVYQKVFAKVVEWFTQGITVLTTGKTK